jgi:NAD+ diphosphatase
MPDKGLLDSLALARGTIDRAAERREDAAWLEAAWADEASKVLVIHHGRAAAIVDASAGGSRGSALLHYLTPSQAPDGGVRVLLAVVDGVVHLGLLLDVAEEAPPEPPGTSWLGLRELGAALGDVDAGVMVAAVALASWHASHPRCPRCGVRTAPTRAGWSRTCPDDGSQHFPRSDPAVIVLVRDADDRALLGRRIDWPAGAMSTLAGFVEAGESAEAAVLRELSEEAGVDIDPGALDYLGSQPWPFPSSLMLGYHARLAEGSRVAIPDGVEIEEVRWFTRDEMRSACESGDLRIPPAVSIARRLIEAWYGGELPGAWSRP